MILAAMIVEGTATSITEYLYEGGTCSGSPTMSSSRYRNAHRPIENCVYGLRTHSITISISELICCRTPMSTPCTDHTAHLDIGC